MKPNSIMTNQKATCEATYEWAGRFPEISFNPLGNTNLMVSQAGFGCYRVHGGQKEHKESLVKAIVNGINLIETSSNYMDGYSEELVGKVIKEMVDEGTVTRESLVVITKGGYLQGDVWQESQKRKKSNGGYDDLVVFCEGTEHCIHPLFLEEQITASLKRLQLDAVDGYLLHNPEHFLKAETGFSEEEKNIEYYNRIRKAFAYLETEVEKGRISFYGVSSNSFSDSKDTDDFTSLTEIIKVAESVSANHHFKVIQFPLNLLETGGVTEKNQPCNRSVLEVANENQIGVIVNRPLNAVLGDRRFRLTEHSDTGQITVEDVNRNIQELIEKENIFSGGYVDQFNFNDEVRDRLPGFFSIGKELMNHWKDFHDFVHWKEILYQFFLPRIETAVQIIADNNIVSVEHEKWISSYLVLVNNTMKQISTYYKGKVAWKKNAVKDIVVEVDKDWSSAGNLSQMAIRAIRSTAGVSSVLVGMRQDNYVEDVISELKKSISYGSKIESWTKMKEI
ncbi:MAG: aldo/keto reductase [Desulfobacteraceae bacterium]|nr:aldo/keto reductase [Desulfobacteraceae bacterium]